ncbi:MAG: EscU/YscU/HrcU family type III secretion system export apparatus switch protein, partial [Janthinobacterium lividum]
MAEDSDLEKTEPASARRLEKAREEGDIPRSRELATVTMLLAAGCGVWFTGDSTMRQLSTLVSKSLSFDRAMVFDFNLLVTRSTGVIVDVLLAFAPLAGLLMLVAIASPVLIGGFLFSGKALVPNFARMNPFSGLMKMISTNALVELGKAVGKTLVVGTVGWIALSGKTAAMLDLANMPVMVGSAMLGKLLFSSFIAIVSGLVLIALIDAPYQMWHHANKLKMTREEVKRENRESDGNPEIKAKIRQQQRAMARRRMMSEVPGADVVVTNPTHYAVALKYADGMIGAPRVVAKGADVLAARIKEIAGENKVAVLEAPSLARALYT